MPCSRRARYVRAVHVTFNPFIKSSAVLLLSVINAKKVLEASPKLVVTKELQNRTSDTAMMKIVFADESQLKLDLRKLKSWEVIEKVNLENGRIAIEEINRGKAYS